MEKGLFYLTPCIELCFTQSVQSESKGVKGECLIIGLCEKPYDQVHFYLAFLFWSYRFKWKFRKLNPEPKNEKILTIVDYKN